MTNKKDELDATSERGKEDENFDGDRSLTNSILFKLQFGSWLCLDNAIHAGDVGCVIQQLTIWIFFFFGSTHMNYATFLTEFHCLLKHESSPEMWKRIIINYLVKFGFDDEFYHSTIAPNVQNFHSVKRSFVDAYDLTHKLNHYTLPALLPEIHITNNCLSLGYNALNSGKMNDFIVKTMACAKFIAAMEKGKRKANNTDIKMQDI
ncbi:hypothetical protein Moror_6095 [Moniliophthora roreri MCA 2997]|uniref:DUF6589 domain-containing protein n=1 Tax=Moniliophthora roreri (strain MCA 2997) TaxID=1381753 RepID=V2WSN2_MONRO|nr:hypothetical protein Moror_6095 [Moniliophthora roreri MCA 2997]